MQRDMPDLTSKVCGAPGCFEVVTTGYCETHQRAARLVDRQRRGRRNDARYDARWARYSRTFRLKHPRCQMCVDQGRALARLTAVTDHIVPVDLGGPMWPRWNHQPLCHEHHNSDKQRQDRALAGYLEDQLPLREAVCRAYGPKVAERLREAPLEGEVTSSAMATTVEPTKVTQGGRK